MREKDRASAMFTLDELAETIDRRAEASAEASYTRSLLDKGAAHCARKFGEEAIELMVAAAAQDENAVRAEAADVLYHLLVLLRARGVAFASVMSELDESRTRHSGHEEKASRRPESVGARAHRAVWIELESRDESCRRSIARIAFSPLHPRRMGEVARRHAAHPHDRRSAQAAVDARPDLDRRGRRHLSAAVAAARALCRGDAGAVQGDAAVPRRDRRQSPYIIGIAGSVAVGKSTTARVLQALLTRWPNTPKVQLVTTDGFLHPNAELIRQGIMDRKGFPESYDGTALIRFLSAVKAGQHNVAAPVYSHLTYDIVPGETILVDRPDILIVEGINVLLPNRLPRDGKEIPFVSDFFDFSIFLDADDALLEHWYIERFMGLRDDGVPRSAQLFPPIRRSRRCGSRGDGALDLAAHQSCQPAREYPADAAARRPAADQGREPPDRGSRAEEAVRRRCDVRRSTAFAFASRHSGLSRARSRAARGLPGEDLTQVAGLAAAEAKRADDLVNADGLLWRIEKPGLAPSYLSARFIRPTTPRCDGASARRSEIKGAKVVATELGGPFDSIEKANISAAMLAKALDRDHDTFEGVSRRRTAS